MEMKRGEHLLSEIEEFPSYKANKLGELWIASGEQLVSIAATEDGRQGLAQYLDVSLDELERDLNLVKKQLPPYLVKRLEEPIDITEYGFGALDPADRGLPPHLEKY